MRMDHRRTIGICLSGGRAPTHTIYFFIRAPLVATGVIVVANGGYKLSGLQLAWEAVKLEERALRSALAAKQNERRAIEEVACAVRVGDIVVLTCRGKNEGVEAVVMSVDPQCMRSVHDKPWLIVGLRKRNGVFSKQAVRAFHDWEPRPLPSL